jgi:hypothetical protein
VSTTGLIRKNFGLLGTLLSAAVWIGGTLWLGLVGIVSGTRFLIRARRSFTTSLRCPRGHRVELYGTFRCPRCKALREGRAFDPCSICGARSTHLDCERCGLAVRDPLL